MGVWLTGKRHSWPYSDLDLAIMTETPLTFLERDNLKEAFSESDLVWKVDIIDWASTSEEFRQIIQKKYVVIQ